MFQGIPSVHQDLDGSEFPSDGKQHQQEFGLAVRRAVELPDFPRRSFFLQAAARLIQVHEDYMQEMGGQKSL